MIHPVYGDIGVGVIVGVFNAVGVSVMVGVLDFVGVNVIVGVLVFVAEGVNVGVLESVQVGEGKFVNLGVADNMAVAERLGEDVSGGSPDSSRANPTTEVPIFVISLIFIGVAV